MTTFLDSSRMLLTWLALALFTVKQLGLTLTW